MSSTEFYLVTLAVFFCFDAIQALGFNLQFGVAGVINLAYILLVAVGAYATAIATVGPAPKTGFETYAGGFHWPFPFNLLFGVACATLVGVLLGFTAIRRLRHDYLALALVAIAQGAQIFSATDIKLLDGVTGITNVQGPFSSLSIQNYDLAFLGMSFVILLIVYVLTSRVTGSPFGRALRAVRDDETGVAALGKSTFRLRFVAFVWGAALAGLGGGLTVLYTGGWNPYAWLPTESAVLLAAIIVGGRGRNRGAVFGALVIMVGAAQAPQFLPQIGAAQLLPSLQIMAVGFIVLAFLWWRPDGIFPEQKESFRRYEASDGLAALESSPAGGSGGRSVS
jgi:branched-chain amino acid transport system permease protein